MPKACNIDTNETAAALLARVTHGSEDLRTEAGRTMFEDTAAETTTPRTCKFMTFSCAEPQFQVHTLMQTQMGDVLMVKNAGLDLGDSNDPELLADWAQEQIDTGIFGKGIKSIVLFPHDNCAGVNRTLGLLDSPEPKQLAGQKETPEHRSWRLAQSKRSILAAVDHNMAPYLAHDDAADYMTTGAARRLAFEVACAVDTYKKFLGYVQTRKGAEDVTVMCFLWSKRNLTAYHLKFESDLKTWQLVPLEEKTAEAETDRPYRYRPLCCSTPTSGFGALSGASDRGCEHATL